MRKCPRRQHLIRPDAKMLEREARIMVEGRVQRLAPNGRWLPDDGVSPGLAFTAGVIAWFPGPNDCGCHGGDRCIRVRALRHISAHYPYGTANGRMVTEYVETNA